MLRKIFNDGKKEALERLGRLDECAFGAASNKTPMELTLILWILNQRWLLKEDLRNSPLFWPDSGETDIQATCAHTFHRPHDPIRLSYAKCRGTIRTAEDAEWVLLHELGHHTLPESDMNREDAEKENEARADLLADLVLGAKPSDLDLKAVDAGGSCMEPIVSPFDANACSGPALMPDVDLSPPVNKVLLRRRTFRSDTTENYWWKTRILVPFVKLSVYWIFKFNTSILGLVSELPAEAPGKVTDAPCRSISAGRYACDVLTETWKADSPKKPLQFFVQLTRGCIRIWSDPWIIDDHSTDSKEAAHSQFGALIWLQ